MNRQSISLFILMVLATPLLSYVTNNPGDVGTANAQDRRVNLRGVEDALRGQIIQQRDAAIERLDLLRQRIDLIEKELKTIDIDQLVMQQRQQGDKNDTTIANTVPKAAKTQAFIVGNSPYYQVMGDMVRRNGWTERHSFNTGYAKYLPNAKGHTLLIESHGGIPIVPAAELDRVFPGASKQLRKSKIVEIDGTRLMLVEFSTLIPGSDLQPSMLRR